MAEEKIYHAPDLDLQHLGHALARWFQGQGFETQTLEAPGGGLVVQARKAETWRSLVGMSAALNVTMTQQDERLVVQMGAAQWADKAVLGAVGALVFWPALIPAAFGAWKQKQLPQQTFQFIDQYLALGGDVSEAALAEIMGRAEAATLRDQAAAVAPPSEQIRCPSCGQLVREGAKFCGNCGASLQLNCPQCGQALRPGAKFCDSCGARVESVATA